MSHPRANPEPRVDIGLRALFEKGLKCYTHPGVRFVYGILEKDIARCYEENLGPGTRAHEFGQRLANALRRFE